MAPHILTGSIVLSFSNSIISPSTQPLAIKSFLFLFRGNHISHFVQLNSVRFPGYYSRILFFFVFFLDIFFNFFFAFSGVQPVVTMATFKNLLSEPIACPLDHAHTQPTKPFVLLFLFTLVIPSFLSLL